MSRLSQWNDQAIRLAGQVGETIKDVVPDRAMRLAGQVGGTIKDAVPGRAMRWVETGAALGVLRTGSRTAGKFVRRHPVALVAAAAGAGVVWYALRQRAKRKADGGSDEAGSDVIEGRARRIEARRSRSTRTRRSQSVDSESGATAH